MRDSSRFARDSLLNPCYGVSHFDTCYERDGKSKACVGKNQRKSGDVKFGGDGNLKANGLPSSLGLLNKFECRLKFVFGKNSWFVVDDSIFCGRFVNQ